MLGLARSPALGVGPVPIALAEHDRVVQVVLEPRNDATKDQRKETIPNLGSRSRVMSLL